MPLSKGKSQKTISRNISEFHKGPTFAHTAEKFGKKRADQQAVAVALSEARRTGKGQSMPTKKSTGYGHSGSHTSVGCGHAGKCSCGVGSGQRAAFLKKPVGRGQAKPDDVQHERQEMKLVKKLEKMHPPSKLRVGTGQAAPAVGTGAGHHIRGQGRKAAAPRVGIPERSMLPPSPPRSGGQGGEAPRIRPPVGGGGPWGDPPRTNRPSMQPMPPAPSVGGGSVFGGTAGGSGSFAAPGVGTPPKTNAGPIQKWAPKGGGSVAPPLKTNMPGMSADTSPAGLGSKPGRGQARPVIPGIQQQRGAPAPVSFGEPAMPSFTQGSPRSTRQGPYNAQGQGPPMQKGKVGAGRPKKQGATVHPPKGRATKKMTP